MSTQQCKLVWKSAVNYSNRSTLHFKKITTFDFNDYFWVHIIYCLASIYMNVCVRVLCIYMRARVYNLHDNHETQMLLSSISNWGKVKWFARNYRTVKWHWQKRNPELADFKSLRFLFAWHRLLRNTHYNAQLEAMWNGMWENVTSHGHSDAAPQMDRNAWKILGSSFIWEAIVKAVDYKKATASVRRTEHRVEKQFDDFSHPHLDRFSSSIGALILSGSWKQSFA